MKRRNRAELVAGLCAGFLIAGCGDEPEGAPPSACEREPVEQAGALCASVRLPANLAATPEKVSFHMFDALPPAAPPSFMGEEVVEASRLGEFKAGEEVRLTMTNLPSDGALMPYIAVYMPGGGAQTWRLVEGVDWHGAPSWDTPLTLTGAPINLVEPIELELYEVPRVDPQTVEYPLPGADVKAIFAEPYTYPHRVCDEEDPELCIWQNAQGCVPEGRRFGEIGDCRVAMTTSARFYKYPGAKRETPREEAEALKADAGWATESEWARDQVRACGCACCHDSTAALQPGFATAFDVAIDTKAPDAIWTDTFTDFGLLTAAGVIDTTLLGGTFDPATNHGFDRSETIMPTTDAARLKRFFESEIERRGLTDAQIQEQIDAVPLRFAGLYTNYAGPTEPCGEREGVDDEGRIWWLDGGARYVYVLEADSRNPADPPGLDRPDGVLWRLDVDRSGAPVDPGAVTYGVVPPGARQDLPEQGAPPALEPGVTYKLFVLRDFGPTRLANCSFQAP